MKNVVDFNIENFAVNLDKELKRMIMKLCEQESKTKGVDTELIQAIAALVSAYSNRIY
jgi:hypothetical protein